MNNFLTVQSGAGLLKQVYDPPATSPTEEALRRRLKRNSDKIKDQTNNEDQIGG